MSALIPAADHEAIIRAITVLVHRHGHPDEIPLGALADDGVPPGTAEKCEALLSTDDQIISDPAKAIARWLRLIGDHSTP